MRKISLCFILLLNLFRKQNTQVLGEEKRRKSRNVVFMEKENWLLRNPSSAQSLKSQSFSLLSHLQAHHFLQVIWVLVLFCFALSVPLFLVTQKNIFLLLITSVIESVGSNQLINPVLVGLQCKSDKKFTSSLWVLRFG